MKLPGFNADDLFIGRSQEMRRLLAIWQKVKPDQPPQFLFVQGESGIGKTTLINTFISKVQAAEHGVVVSKAQCSMNVAEGYGPFRDIFFSLYDQGLGLGLSNREVLELILGQAGAWIKILTTDPRFAAVEKIAESIHGFFSFVNQKNLVFTQKSVAEQFCGFLNRIIGKKKLIIFIDDLHWGDESTLSLLPIMMEKFDRGSLLLICAHRPNSRLDTREQEFFGATLSRCIQKGAQTVDITEGISVKSFTEKHFPSLSLSPDFTREIQTRTDGHPVFIESLFASWIEKGILVAQTAPDGKAHWKLTRPEESIQLPVQLTELINGQLKDMSEELRELLEIASVEGEDFTIQVLSRLTSSETLQTRSKLRSLEQQHRMIKHLTKNEYIGAVIFDFYGFWHAFIQEYIHDSHLNSTDRRLLHEGVGKTLEYLYQDHDVSPVAAQLARHFHEAKINLKAARYFLIAARREQSRYAWETSERWCLNGIGEIRAISPEQNNDAEVKKLLIELLKTSTWNHNHWGNYEKAVELMQLALETAITLSLPREEIAHLYRETADYLEFVGRFEEGQKMVALGKALLPDAGGATLISLSLDLSQAQLLTHEDENIEEAIKQFEKILFMSQMLPDSPELTQLLYLTYNQKGLCLLALDRFGEAHAALRKSQEIALAQGNLPAAMLGMLNLAYSLLDFGKIDESLALAEKGLNISRQIASVDDEAYAYTVQAGCFLQQGRYEEALELQKQAVEIHTRTNSTWNFMYLHADMAIAYLGIGDTVRAEEAANVARDYAESDFFEQAYSLEIVARVQAARKEWTEAEKNFLKVIEGYEEFDSAWHAARTKKYLGMMYRQKGDPTRAREYLETGLTEMESLNSSFEAGLIRQALDELLLP
jgi:predicted ATPase